MPLPFSNINYINHTLEARKWKHVPCISDATNQDSASYPIDDEHTGNIVTSECVVDGKLHLPVIDIDHPCELFDSPTEGHHHLYINKPVTWEQYVKLLEALVECGIVEENYLKHTLRHGHTCVRHPEFFPNRPRRGSFNDRAY